MDRLINSADSANGHLWVSRSFNIYEFLCIIHKKKRRKYADTWIIYYETRHTYLFAL